MKAAIICLAAFLALLQASAEDWRIAPTRGFYSKPIAVRVTGVPPESEIYFTRNGSAPTKANGERYRRPLEVTTTTVLRLALYADGKLMRTKTHTYLFPDKVAQQPAYPEGYIREVEAWRLPEPQEFDWAIDSEVLTDSGISLTESLLDLPALSIAVDRDEFNAIYEDHTERGEFYERASSVELLYPPNKKAFQGFAGFQIDCGLRMQGGGAVTKARKKSFRLLFKKAYGPGKLKYPLFESAVHHASTATQAFDNVILRAGGNTNWSKDEAWKHEPSTYLRDALVRDTQIAVTGYGARSTFAHLFINGFYFGLYNIAERPDNKFQAGYWGGDASDYFAVNHGGIVDGDETRWRHLMGLAHRARFSLETAHREIDLQSFCDYLIVHWALGTGDWPWNNYYAGMRTQPDGPLRFFSWDAEFSLWTDLGYLQSNDRGWANPLFVNGWSRRRSPLITLWNALENNRDFRMLFADRVYHHCFGDGALTDSAMRARFKRLMTRLDKAIVAESARWGDAAWGQEDDPRTREDNWLPQCQALLRLLDGNMAGFIADLQAHGLYPKIRPPQFEMSKQSLRLHHANQVGDIFYTLNGGDPRRTDSGEIANKALKWSDPVSIATTARLNARVFVDGIWSPLLDKLLLAEKSGFPLRIAEIMPDPPVDQALEFIALKNVSNADLDISNFRFTGVTYQFPPRTILAGRQTILIVPNDNPARFREVYPNLHPAGYYRGHLSNDGEKIELLDPGNQVITSVIYGGNERSWPRGTRGKGYSLIPKRVEQAPKKASEWRASERPRVRR